MVRAQIGDVMKVEIRNHNSRTIIITLTTQAQVDYANQLLSDPSSGWQLEKAPPPTPSLLAYEAAMQAAGVPKELLEVYTSNSWHRVGLARTYKPVVTPTAHVDGQLDIDGSDVLVALVAAFNAMLELRPQAATGNATDTPARSTNGGW